jgi:hypothetical protein
MTIKLSKCTKNVTCLLFTFDTFATCHILHYKIKFKFKFKIYKWRKKIEKKKIMNHPFWPMAPPLRIYFFCFFGFLSFLFFNKIYDKWQWYQKNIFTEVSFLEHFNNLMDHFNTLKNLRNYFKIAGSSKDFFLFFW